MSNREINPKGVMHPHLGPAVHNEDELARAFPGREITHEFRIKSGSNLTDAIALLSRLHASGASVESVRFARCAGRHFDYHVRVKGIASRPARELADDLATLSGVVDARVEHHLICA